jgi:hypothetical protein
VVPPTYIQLPGYVDNTRSWKDLIAKDIAYVDFSSQKPTSGKDYYLAFFVGEYDYQLDVTNSSSKKFRNFIEFSDFCPNNCSGNGRCKVSATPICICFSVR